MSIWWRRGELNPFKDGMRYIIVVDNNILRIYYGIYLTK